MTMTDTISLVFLLVLAVNGAYKGFLRSLVKPVALVLSLALSWSWYFNTHNFNAACLISITGPFIISWLINLGIKRWVNADPIPEISLMSRLGGQAVGLISGSILIAITVAFMAVFPFKRFELGNWEKDVQHSKALAIIRPTLISKGILSAAPTPAPCLNDVCKVDENDKADLSSDKDMLELMNDPHIQKLLNDPEAMSAIQSQNIGKIMSNPAINELKSDPAFVLKAMRLYPKIQQKINAHELEAGNKNAAPAAP